MKKYSSNLAFIDLLFNMLTGFTCLFIISFLLINPVAKDGVVEPPVKLIVEARWDDESKYDVDLWVSSPNSLVGYISKESGYATLSRDDLGRENDTYIINGEKKTIKRNYEVTNFTALPDGEYVINVHMFSGTYPTNEMKVNVRITQVAPFNTVYEGDVTLRFAKEEKTAVSFVVRNGEITDINTDLQRKVRIAQEAAHL
jgi:hypothetical protein